MRRGFKTQAEADAARLRGEIGLVSTDRLDPFAVADYLGVVVLPLQRMLTHGVSLDAIAYFRGPGRSEFSATTVTDDDGYYLIVYNERHAGVRRVSNVCHELGHVILFHEPTQLVDETGHRFWDRDRESEADWFGATLLVPRTGALALLDQGMDAKAASEHFGVSEALFNWRVQQTGVIRQLRYREDARRRRRAVTGSQVRLAEG